MSSAAFALASREVTADDIRTAENVHRLIAVALGEPENEVLGFPEAAEVIKTTIRTIRWYISEKNVTRPMASHLFPVKGRKLPIRYFLRSDLQHWKKTYQNRDIGWPPNELQILNSPNGKMLTPKEKSFPDNGDEIPGYQSLSGRWIQPVWRNCRNCGKRFISPDRRNIHNHDFCYQLLHE